MQVSSDLSPAKIPLAPNPAGAVTIGASPLGEIRLWRGTLAFSQEEVRLLDAFAGQGVLALERARLARTATQTRLLEESDRLKTAILSSVSHELRSPLAAIKAAVTSLRSEDIEWNSEMRSELLAVIEEDTDQLNQLVGNLLDMSRLEAGRCSSSAAGTCCWISSARRPGACNKRSRRAQSRSMPAKTCHSSPWILS